MKTSRRKLLTIAGGAAAALPLTPVPWKVADDVSIWTQNWSWTPVPKRGELNVRYTTCTLCPAGCGLKARCIGAQPISLAPVAQHPVSRGTLCPLAFGAHQLPWHPLRSQQPLHNGTPVPLEGAIAEVAARAKSGRLAVLDESPGRSASVLYAQMMARRPGALYVVPRNPDAATLDAIASMAAVPAGELGFDLENVRSVLSFGAPLLDGWGTPGRVLALWKAEKLRIVQVEPSLSRTATLAHRWLAVRPGSEASVARALAGFTTLADASAAAGVPEQALEAAARELHAGGPALALSGGNLNTRAEAAIAALNAKLGMNGIVRRPVSSPDATPLGQLEPGSIDLLIIDHGPSGGTVPWTAVRSKLAPGAMIVSLTPYRAGVAEHAQFVIPAPAFLESIQDRLTPWDAAVESYSIAPALLRAPGTSVEPAEFVARVLGVSAGGLETEMRARVASLHTGGQGEIFTFADAQRRPVKHYDSADKLWEALLQGACWIGDSRGKPAACPAAVDPGWEEAPAAGILLCGIAEQTLPPPLATKLDQEARVRRRRGRVYLHPQTGPFGNGDRVAVTVAGTTFTAAVMLDASVGPGLAESADAPPGLTPATLQRT